MSSRCLQDIFSVTIFRLPRRLQDVLQDVFKTSLQDVFKMFSRCLQDVLEDVKLLRRRRVEDVFKTICLLGQCWENAKYSRRETLEIAGLPKSLTNDAVETKVYQILDCNVSKEIWMFVVGLRTRNMLL